MCLEKQKSANQTSLSLSKSRSKMHRQRIGMSQILLPLVLSCLLIATNAARNPKTPEMTTHTVTPPRAPPQPHHAPPQPRNKLPARPPQPRHKTPARPPQPRHVFPKPKIPGTQANAQPPKPKIPGTQANTQPPTPKMPGTQTNAQPPKPGPTNSGPMHPTPPPQDPSSSNMNAGDLAKEFLSLHNTARRGANLPPLVWDAKLEQYAKQYAVQRGNAKCGDLVHSNGPYGENLFWGGGPNWQPKDAVKAWMGEQKFYDPDGNQCKDGQMCGHYTQMVWRDSCRLGCVLQRYKDNDTFIICSYDPPGNYLGEKPFLHYNH